MRKFQLLAALFFASWTALAQEVTLVGTVVEQGNLAPLPQAALLERSADGAVVQYQSTDASGAFELKVQLRNRVEVSFMGFETWMFDDLMKRYRDQAVTNGTLDLGEVVLTPLPSTLDEVDVVAEKSSMEFKLDKRVFNVGKDISSTGMGALDLLGNVPSVTVDIEGQIALRGNTGVQILINGKPSVMSDEGGSALGTLTGDMIERIEVITNPSAKYEAEGTAGIINIVLKKEEKKGFNGSLSANLGSPANHSVGVSLNRRTEQFNLFTQMGAGRRSIPTYTKNENVDLVSGARVLSEGLEFRNENFYTLLLGTDYHLNDFNVLTLSGRFALEVEDQPSATEFEVLDGAGALKSAYERREITTAMNPKYEYDLQYKKQFKDHEDHVLLMSTLAHFFGKDLEASFENSTTAGTAVPDQRTQTSFYESTFTHKMDYTRPWSDRWTLETGAMYDVNDVGNEFAVFNEGGAGQWLPDSNFTNHFTYLQKVLGLYATTAYENQRWGVKAGLRREWTDLQTRLVTTDEENHQLYANWFPSLHSSYKINERLSLQTGYSRRIFRPRLWDLNPFFNIRNNFSIRRGNPNLLPEFGHSLELTGIYIQSNYSLNASVYYLHTSQVIDRVSYFEDNVSIFQPINLGTRAQTGLELNGKYTPSKWLTFNGDFNYGVFTRTGNFEGQSFDFQGDRWTGKLTAKTKLPGGLEAELTGQYESRERTVQGMTSGFGVLDGGLRQKLWKGRGVLNFAVQDAFASRIRERVIAQENFEVYSFSKRGTFFTLGFSYSLGKGEAMTYSGKRHY